jgi:uncharacterized protein
MGFSRQVQEKLGWYVYLLADPRNQQVFYVGKGRGDRAYAHALDAQDVLDHPELQSAKHQRILEIERSGHEVSVLVLRHAIDSAKQAYVIEAAAIDLMHHLQPGALLNVVLGHHHAQHGLMSAADVEGLYNAPPAPEPKVPILLVSLNKLWTPTLTAEELQERTTGWWKASGVLKKKPAYIMGVHNGVVRSVYKPLEWRTRREGDRGWKPEEALKPSRYGCTVNEAPEMRDWLNKDVTRFLTANPQWSIRYIGPV